MFLDVANLKICEPVYSLYAGEGIQATLSGSAAVAHAAQLDHQARFDKMIMVDMISGLPVSRKKNEAVLAFTAMP
eukprot:757497-Hanusia_phi.AAC.1